MLYILRRTCSAENPVGNGRYGSMRTDSADDSSVMIVSSTTLGYGVSVNSANDAFFQTTNEHGEHWYYVDCCEWSLRCHQCIQRRTQLVHGLATILSFLAWQLATSQLIHQIMPDNSSIAHPMLCYDFINCTILQHV